MLAENRKNDLFMYFMYVVVVLGLTGTQKYFTKTPAVSIGAEGKQGHREDKISALTFLSLAPELW